MDHLVEQANLNFIVTGKIKETSQIVTAMKIITLHNPKLIVEVRFFIFIFFYQANITLTKLLAIVSISLG